jgi:hypothetical protein
VNELVNPNLGHCYRLARQRAAERRRQMEQFSAAEFAAGVFGGLADLAGQARRMALAATDPELRHRHTVVFWHLYGELQRRATQ